MNLINTILKDQYRYVGNNSFRGFCYAYIIFEGFRFSVWLRLCSYLREKKFTKYTILPFAVVVYRHYKHKYGYDIPFQINIGPGLLIYHFGGIVISARQIGKNFTVSQNVTVGMRIVDGEKKYPIIEDNVYLAPGCAVVGDLTIGKNCAIGTNSVVTKDMPENSVVVGIPGHIISRNGAVEYLNHLI